VNKKVILIIALFAAAGVLLYTQLQPSAEDEAYLRRYEETRQQAAQAQTQAASAPAASAGGGAAAPAAGGTVQAQFREVDIDVEALVEQAREVEFNYEQSQLPRDPMKPLVGPDSFQDVAVGPGDEAPTPRLGEARAAAMRKAVTGIVWDETNPIAVIVSGNEQDVVSEGYEFPLGIVVERIEPDRVVLRVENSLIPITLEE